MMRLLIILVICAQAFAVDKVLAAVPQLNVPTAGSHSKEHPKNDKLLPVDSHQHRQPQLPENNKIQINKHNGQVVGHVKQEKTPNVGSDVHNPTSPTQVPHSSQPTAQHLQQQVEQVAQHHIPQVMSHYTAQQEELKQQHKHDVGKQETPNKMRASRAVHHHHVPHKSSHHGQKHRPHVHHHSGHHHVSHHHHHHNKKRSKRASHAPSHVQQLVQQVHQHVPHVFNHHVQQHNQKTHADHTYLEPPRKCNYDCTHLDLAVCATNGQCWTEFGSLCQMSNWNCLHTQKAFTQVLDAECMDSARPKCYPGDMLN